MFSTVFTQVCVLMILITVGFVSAKAGLLTKEGVACCTDMALIISGVCTYAFGTGAAYCFKPYIYSFKGRKEQTRIKVRLNICKLRVYVSSIAGGAFGSGRNALRLGLHYNV